MPNFSKELKALLFGNPFGEVYPARPNPPTPVVDGRTHALRVLKRYFQEIVFVRSGGKDASGNELPPISFQIPERDIHIEWPDNPEDAHLPAIAFLAEDRGQYETIGMTNYVDEESRDKYGPGTILIWMSEYQETFVVELWTQTKAQRRSMISGLEVAFSPLQQMAGIRFKMPDYFDQLVCFELQDKEIVDDDLAVRNRRRARFRVLMRFNVVALVNAADFEPVVTVDDGDESDDSDDEG